MHLPSVAAVLFGLFATATLAQEEEAGAVVTLQVTEGEETYSLADTCSNGAWGCSLIRNPQGQNTGSGIVQCVNGRWVQIGNPCRVDCCGGINGVAYCVC